MRLPLFYGPFNVETGFSSSRVRLFVHLFDWILENYGGWGLALDGLVVDLNYIHLIFLNLEFVSQLKAVLTRELWPVDFAYFGVWWWITIDFTITRIEFGLELVSLAICLDCSVDMHVGTNEGWFWFAAKNHAIQVVVGMKDDLSIAEKLWG